MKRLKKPVLFLLLLEVLAIAGNLLNIEIFVGVNFLFSSVFVFIVIHYFGVRWGVLVSFLSALPTIILWGTPYGLVTLVLEAFFVGYMYHNHKKNLILWDMLFASIIAIPLSIFTSKLLLDLDWSNTIFIMLKQSVNMIFNVLIANFLLILIESIRNKRNQKKFSVQELLFNLLMIFFLFPLLGSLIYIGNSEYIKVKDKIDVAMEQAHNKIYIGLTTNIQKYSNQLQNSKVGLQNASALYNEENVMQTKEVIDFAQKYTVFKKVYAFNYSSPNEKIYLEVSDTAYKSFPVKGELNPYFRDILYLDVSSLRNHYVTDVFQYNNKELMSIIVPVTTGDSITNIVGYTGAVFPIVYLRKDLKELDDFTTDDINYQITDRNGRKIYFSKQYEDQNENVIPLQYGSDEDVVTLQEWTNKIYTKTFETPDNIPWDITVQVPVKPYKNNLYQTYINLFIFVFIFSGIALLFSYYLSFHLQKMLTRVASVTTNLPDKISSNQHIEWPVVGIREISNIIHNFKNTENKLRKMIVELLKVQTDLEYLAHFDPLTNVYNRNYFIDKFKDFVFYADDKDEMALLFIDLDRFKIINDMLGHLEGDTVLKGVAERLMNVCKEENVIGRLGGDEFIILVPKILHMDDVHILAQNIINILSLPYNLKGGEYYITASVGISVFPQDGDDIQTLIKNADIAMYSAKERGKNNYQFFDDAIKEKIVSKVQIEQELRHAIERNELELHYQPQVNIQTGKIEGVEALIRWMSPTLGFVSPATFIPIAEDSGMIMEIGNWILETAAKQAKVWHDMGYAELTMSVNISMIQFMNPTLIQSVIHALNKSSLNPSFLKLEITETVAMSEPELVREILLRLKELNIEFALDDFGTGYSSLNYLKNLPVDILKIDRSFIQDIDIDNNDFTIVRALIEVAHSLGMLVIAEGVETTAQLSKLGEVNCDMLQGYVFSRPLPAKEFETLLSSKFPIVAI